MWTTVWSSHMWTGAVAFGQTRKAWLESLYGTQTWMESLYGTHHMLLWGDTPSDERC